LSARRGVLVLCGVVLSGCVLGWSLTGDQTQRVASHVVLYGLAFAAYLGGLWGARGLSRRALWLALGVGIVWRGVLVVGPPLISDDINRYVWEGRIQLHGGNPYAWRDRPEAEKWQPLRDAVWEGINHRDYTAVYPPLWQLAGRLAVGVHDSVQAMKAFLVLCELLTLGALGWLLARRRLPRERLLIMAWSPLCLVEIAGSGHNEAFGMLFLVLGLLALEAGHPLASALGVVLAFHAKLLPGLLALPWARRYRPVHALAGLALAAALVLPYADAGWGLVMSLRKYSELWRFNETLFAPLAWLVGSHVVAVRVAALTTVAVALALAWRRVEPATATLGVLAAWLLVMPNVLPWYVLWVVPFLVLRAAPPLLLFTGTVGLAYLVYPSWLSGEPWQLSWPLRALEYGPCLAVAALILLRARRRTAEGASA